ncbi:hypothetical protein [Kitasatospora griseola]|uniref:hypothetical protein n=1 Tax=Kitasatospora griseola TaxID=2064 RepID=UPI003438A49C
MNHPYTPAGADTAYGENLLTGSFLVGLDDVAGITADGRIITHPLHRPGAAVPVPVERPHTVIAATATTAPAPAPAAPVQGEPAAEQGLPLALRQAVLLGCALSVSTGTALYLAGMGLAAAQPALHDAIELMKLAIVFVALVVGSAAAAVVYTRRGIRRVRSTADTTQGTPVFTVFHRSTATTIGRQSVRGRANVTNNF